MKQLLCVLSAKVKRLSMTIQLLCQIMTSFLPIYIVGCYGVAMQPYGSYFVVVGWGRLAVPRMPHVHTHTPILSLVPPLTAATIPHRALPSVIQPSTSLCKYSWVCGGCGN